MSLRRNTMEEKLTETITKNLRNGDFNIVKCGLGLDLDDNVIETEE